MPKVQIQLIISENFDMNVRNSSSLVGVAINNHWNWEYLGAVVAVIARSGQVAIPVLT